MPHKDDYNEENISKIPALEVLQQLGYIYLTPAQAKAQRGNLYNVVLTDILREQLDKLNRYDYKGATYQFSEKSITQAIQDLDEPLNEGLMKTNEKIFDRLVLGESYTEKLPDGATRAFTLTYIDWETPENNVFHVTEEFSVEREDGQDTLPPGYCGICEWHSLWRHRVQKSVHFDQRRHQSDHPRPIQGGDPASV